MSLRSVMRKAAGLLVEMPPEEAASGAAPGTAPLPGGSVGDRTEARSAPDIDELLAAVRNPKNDTPDAAKSAAKPGTNAPTATAAQLAQAGKGPNLDQIKSAAAGAVSPGALTGAPAQGAGSVVSAEGKLKVSVVYEAAGVPPTPFTAEQALEVINALPPDLPLEIKRQTVKATLAAIGKTLGATPQTIVADTTRKLAALEAYLESFEKKSSEFVSKVEGEIKTLEGQIAERRKAIENAKLRVGELSKFCDEEAGRLDDVLEFFSLDVGPSKYAPDNQKN